MDEGNQMPLDGWETWRDANGAYLLKVFKLLQEQLPDEETALIDHLRQVEAHHARVGFILAEAESWLDRAIARFYETPAHVELKVNEKKAACDAAVVQERERRNKIQTLSDSIELRINLGQSLLRQQRGERAIAKSQ
jgi:hypothetical protein